MRGALNKANKRRARMLRRAGYVIGSVALLLGAQCEEEDSMVPVPTGPGATSGRSHAAAGGGTDGQLPPCDPDPVERGVYNPDATCWEPVTWSTPCTDLTMAVRPDLGAPPLVWADCPPGSPAGCSQLVQAPMFSQKSAASKGSVLRTASGYRFGLLQTMPDGRGSIAAIYDERAAALIAWRSTDCVLKPPIVTEERVWFGAISVDDNGSAQSTYIAARWDELGTITDTIQLELPTQQWSASSDVLVAWLSDGLTLHIEDLRSGRARQYGGASGLGNPDYAYPHAFGRRVVALTAPDGYPDVAMWDGSSGTMVDLVNPTPPSRVADVNTDGSTLAWIVVPDWESPGELWTSPIAVSPAELSPSLRRTTPPARPHVTAAGSGYYGIWSEKVFGEDGPGDDQLHVYRLADAHHWSFAYAEGLLGAHILYHVDEAELFYSGYGPMTRQRLDAVGPGDAP